MPTIPAYLTSIYKLLRFRLRSVSGRLYYNGRQLRFSSHVAYTCRAWLLVAVATCGATLFAMPVGKVAASATVFVPSAEVATLPSNFLPDQTLVKRAPNGASDIVINEIHFDPPVKTDKAEFVELYNRGTEAVDVSLWALDGAVEFTIPGSVAMQPGEYLVIAQDPATIARTWGVAAVGPYSGKLSTLGEELILRNRNAQIIDQVNYQLGFPWPTVGDAPGPAISLLNARADNARPGSWRSQLPTPGRANQTVLENLPPNVEQVSHNPQQPTSQSVVRIAAQIQDPDTIQSVELLYQIVEPGAYIAISDTEYGANWTSIAMSTDADANSASAVYVAQIPAEVQQHRRLIRYRIRATDAGGASITVPYADDPQPNFAYFVYDGVPIWQGAAKPGGGLPLGELVSYDFSQMRPYPVYHLISKEYDVDKAFFTSGYMGSDYLWQGTMIYNGQVYDHIRYRARGGQWRYGLGKNMLKFDFNRGHLFQAHDDFGQPYAFKWSKLNLGAIIQQSSRGYRGEQGMFESVGFKLFNLAGVPSPKTHFIHFRVIDEASETGGDQYNTDFFGLYLAVEQMDGQFLKEHELPDGNLYKMEWGTGERNNLGADSVADRSDIEGIIFALKNWDLDEQWWRENLDLERYYSFRSMLEAIHHYDVNNEKNYFFYAEPTTNQWSILPWDIDQTWALNMFGSGTDPMVRAGVLSEEKLRLEYENRLREIRDLLFNEEQMFAMLDEHAARIDSPVDGPSMVDADRAMWDYHPIMSSDDVEPTKTAPGQFYRAAENGQFSGMIQVMKKWVQERSVWIDEELLHTSSIPFRTEVAYAGPAGYPADKLRFTTTAFNDPQGPATFAAMEWRAAEVSYPGLPSYTAAAPGKYEIEATWESGELTTFVNTVDVPVGACHPGRICRVRVRMKDTSGRWGHWSAPVEFTTGAPLEPRTESLKISEIMYNPLNMEAISGNHMEFVEITNVGERPLDLTNMQLTGAIEYRFAPGARLSAGDSLVLVSDINHFMERYEFAPFDQYRGQLKNSGERLVLLDAFGAELFSVSYDDGAPWPEIADGQGYSLVLQNPMTTPVVADDPNLWRRSSTVQGSPGGIDPSPVVINEILTAAVDPFVNAIEVWNPTSEQADISYWYFTDDPAKPQKYQIPAGAILPPGGYRIFTEDLFSVATGDRSGFRLNSLGGEIHLYSASRFGYRTGYHHGFRYGAADEGVSFGRHLNSVQQEFFPPQNSLTLGGPNGGPRVGPVVISEVMYHPASGDEYIELTNITGYTIPLYDTEKLSNTWRIPNLAYQFPAGITLAPGERLVLTSGDPSAACISGNYAGSANSQTGTPGGLQIIGPFTHLLPDEGSVIRLEKPAPAFDAASMDPQLGYILVDEVYYDNVAPWPIEAAGGGAPLERKVANQYGNEPSNWFVLDALISAASAQIAVELCTFEAIPSKVDKQVSVRWVTHAVTGVSGFNIWRSTNGQRDAAELLTTEPVPVATSEQNAAAALANQPIQYQFAYTDLTLSESDSAPQTYIYWLQAVGSDGETLDVAFTALRPIVHEQFMPIVAN